MWFGQLRFALRVACLGLGAIGVLGAGISFAAPDAQSLDDLVFTSLRDGHMQIYSIRSDGSNERRLIFSEFSDLQPALAPDGRIAFVSYRSGNGDIYIRDVDGEVRRLTDGDGLEQQPTWSPDGKQIAFLRQDETGFSIAVAGTEDRSTKTLLLPYTDVAHPTWSPDGQHLALVASVSTDTFEGHSTEAINRIVVAALASGEHHFLTSGQSLTKDPGNESDPVWTPDGSQIVFVHTGGRAEGINLLIAPSGGGQPRAITPILGYTNSSPAISPDGMRIAYVSNQSSRGGPMNLHVINLHGGEPQDLSQHDAADFSPRWSGDGKAIFFQSFRVWPGQLFRMNADGSSVVQLTQGDGQSANPVIGTRTPQVSFFRRTDR